MISEKVQRIVTSPTLKISTKAKAMQAEGIDVVDLSVGEPDFPTPDNIKEAAVKAIREGFTKYTETAGILALRKAISVRLKEDFGLEYDPRNILVSTGAKSSLFHLIQALVEEGEEVIIPAPYWVTYPECVNFAKGKSVIVPTREEDGFLLTPEKLRSVITPATKALLLNNPNNPTGAAYTKEDLLGLAEVIRSEDIFVIADEIYANLVFDDFKFTSFAALGEDIKKKTIVINGVSKKYSMTGWRIGYAAGPPEILAAMLRLQSHTTSNACSIAQKASLEAFAGPQHESARMAAEFQRRRNYCLMRLAAVPGLSCFKPQGAFYVFPNVRSFYDKEFKGTRIRNSYGLAYFLLKQARVAVVPGDAFGADDYLRVSYATSMENLEKGMDRLIEAFSWLKPSRKEKKEALSNYTTRVRKAPPVELMAAGTKDELTAEIENHLGQSGIYQWNANINGTIVRLKTNIPHLNDFWIENWFPGRLDEEIEPHGVIYAADGITGRQARSIYDPETRTGILINTDLYSPLRSLALGMALDAAERAARPSGGSGAVRGMSADTDQGGLILVGPPGTNKTELFFELLKDPRFRLHSNEISFIRLNGGRAVAESVERKLYIPTDTVELDERLAPLFDRSRCENVVTHKEDCQNEPCLRADDCRLDRGSLFCYKASKLSRAMLDPAWLGAQAFSRRTDLRWIFLLRKDPTSPAVSELTVDEALRILETGEVPGTKKAAEKAIPYFNPHLIRAAQAPERIAPIGENPLSGSLTMSDPRFEGQRTFFGRFLGIVKIYLFNSGVAGADKIKEIVFGS